MGNLLPGFGGTAGGRAVLPTGGILPGLGGTAGGRAIPVTGTAPGTPPNGTFAGSNLYDVANVGTKRSLLTKAGYSVSANGPETDRLNAAWDNYFHTKGLGGAAWNITPQQFNPEGKSTMTHAQALAAAKGGRATSSTATPSLASQVPGAVPAAIPGSPNFQDLFAGVKAPTNPITDLNQFATNYANSQANTQYNPVINALNQAIGRQPADTNAAMQGIDKLYQPVQDLAAANVNTAADASKQGVQGVQDVATQIGQAFGLGPGAASQRGSMGLGDQIGKATVNNVGTLEQQGSNATAAAKAQQQIAQQGQTDSQNTWSNTEQKSINDLKNQLLSAVTARSAARASGVSTGMQLGQQTESNYLGQLSSLSTGKEQAALADQAYQHGDLQNQGAAQTVAGQTYQNQTAPLILRNQLLGSAAQRAATSQQLDLQGKAFDLKNGAAIAKSAQQAGGWGTYLGNKKNALSFAASMKSLLVDSKTGAPLPGLTPASAYNTIAHTLASATFPSNTPQGQALIIQALQGAGFDLSGYQLDPNGQGLVLIPKATPHALTSSGSSSTPPGFHLHNKGY